jgi:hypothetical protein
MKGYLQRMVADVARPQRTVHPLVGGMFVRDGQRVSLEESAVVNAPQEARQIQVSTVEREKVRALETLDRLVALPSDLAIEHVADVGEQRVQSPTHEVKSGRDAAALSGEKAEASETVKSMPPRGLLMPEIEEQGGSETDGGLLTERNLDRDRSDVMARGRQLPAEPTSRQESERGSEDIQIHIGRIEVIAVPPPVQRSAPATARKTESLQEYLGRRDRRSR